MRTYLIKNTCIINEGKKIFGDVLIKNGRIEKIGGVLTTEGAVIEIDGHEQWLLLYWKINTVLQKKIHWPITHFTWALPTPTWMKCLKQMNAKMISVV